MDHLVFGLQERAYFLLTFLIHKTQVILFSYNAILYRFQWRKKDLLNAGKAGTETM